MTSQKNEKIFVSIASYRDPQIQKTIDSCIDNADSKDDLRIVVCDQWGNSPEEVRPQPQDSVEIIRVNHRSSLGCCCCFLPCSFCFRSNSDSNFRVGNGNENNCSSSMRVQVVVECPPSR